MPCADELETGAMSRSVTAPARDTAGWHSVLGVGTSLIAPQATTSRPHSSSQVLALMRSFAAVAECLCLPRQAISPSAKLQGERTTVSMEVFPDHLSHWYYVRQEPGNELFIVRRVSRLPEEESLSPVKPGFSWDHMDVAAMSELIKRHPLQRAQSVPRAIERRWCLSDNETQEELREGRQCKICFTEPADVVLLPCRHGGMCYRCFRRMLFMRPLHRGGGACPVCRRQISEVVRIGRDELRKPASQPQYGIGASPLEYF